MRRARPYGRRPVVWGTLAALVALATIGLPAAAPGAEETQPRPASFANGFPADPSFFPVGVWLQHPRNAAVFSAMGVNTFVGLWRPPTEAQLAQLEANGLYLIVEQTQNTRALRNAHVVRAWLQGDEPDNAQSNGLGGYGDCILPEQVVERYRQMQAFDLTRPVFLNFGQAVANPQWFGRGAKCGRIAPEDYYRPASRGADMVSFDIYPAAEERQAHVMGKLDLVGRGVANLKRWARPGQPVWAAIETTHINHPSRRPQPHEVRSEVWMALIHGANGIFYFVHEWQPSFREDGVLRYPDTVREITLINEQVRKLAPVLNAPTVEGRVRVEADVEIATMVKRHGEETFVFAVNMTNAAGKARLALEGIAGAHAVVLSEDRIVRLEGGAIMDRFKPYEAHLYRVP